MSEPERRVQRVCQQGAGHVGQVATHRDRSEDFAELVVGDQLRRELLWWVVRIDGAVF